jgi:hypothetical protein
MINLTNFEKQIYNCYLKNFRKGEPYKIRKDFSNINPNIAVYLQKIGNFLTKYPHINVNEYFEAPNSLYKDEKYPPLKSFISRTAIRDYSLYQKQKQDKNPENQFEEIKNSFRFIGMFCVDKKIPFNKYLTDKSGCIYSWLNHYREHRVNPYSLFEFGNVISTLDDIPKDELSLFAQNLQENIIAFHNRYKNSPKTKQYCQTIYKKVSDFVEKELHNL